MAVNLAMIGGAGWQFFDNNGNVLSGGKVYTYAAGTTTPQTTYTDRTGNTPNANPIILDSAGRTPYQIWSTEGLLYKYTIKTSDDVLIRVWDNIGGSVVASNLATDLAAPTGSSLVGYISAGTGAVATTVQNKLRQISVSIVDYGAVANATGASGVGTDNTAAIQRALNYVNSVGGGVVTIPPGMYRKSDTGGTLIMYSNTTLRGEGDSSIIFFDDTTVNGRQDFLYADNTQNINFENFKITGTALIYTNEVNQSQLLCGGNIAGLRVTGMTIEKVRFMATAFNYVQNGFFSGNRFDYIVRDGIRCTNSSNIVVTGNTLVRVADDCIALHSLDAAAIPGSGFIISDNIIDRCQGIKVLGAKILNITGNIIKMSLRGPILVTTSSTGTEGATSMLAINISNNIITDTFQSVGGNYTISVLSQLARNNTIPQPGIGAAPYPYNYTNNLDVSGVVVGAFGVTVSNNTLSRTLQAGVFYSDYGFGDMFDRATPNFFSNPAIVETDFSVHGVVVQPPINGLSIQGNLISGSNVGKAAVFLTSSNGSNNLAFSNTVVSDNTIIDFPGIGINLESTGALGNLVIVRNNIFDLDPYFRSPSHNADNTWTSAGNCVGISNSATVASLIAENNVFMHLGTCITHPGQNSNLRGTSNIVICEPTGVGDLSTNKGVRNIQRYLGYTFVIYNGDPSSASFRSITTFPVLVNNTLPTSGFYIVGSVITADEAIVLGTAGSRYLITGWTRLTTGSAHVLNTDWAEMRTLTGT